MQTVCLFMCLVSHFPLKSAHYYNFFKQRDLLIQTDLEWVYESPTGGNEGVMVMKSFSRYSPKKILSSTGSKGILDRCLLMCEKKLPFDYPH